MTILGYGYTKCSELQLSLPCKYIYNETINTDNNGEIIVSLSESIKYTFNVTTQNKNYFTFYLYPHEDNYRITLEDD